MAVRLKAYTLFESVIAMLIIVTVFAIASYSIVSTAGADDSYKKTKILFEFNRMADSMKVSRQFIDAEEVIDDIHYFRKAEKYKDAENLIQLHFSAKTEDGTLIYEQRELVLE